MTECIFCKIVLGQAPSWMVLEDKYCYAFLDINPVSKYHTLVIPKKHCTNMFDVSEQTALAVMRMIKKVVDLYQTRLHLQHLQIICSNGRHAQQDVFHLHYHIVPRSQGDGQNIRWKVHREWRASFDEMLQQLL